MAFVTKNPANPALASNSPAKPPTSDDDSGRLFDGICLTSDGGVETPNKSDLRNMSRTPAHETGRESCNAIKRPKRVRTGCLTCRERHLKCDEALHQCQNCRKSGRSCRWGIRLNFIDTQVMALPHHMITRPMRVGVTFQDESRKIASEYVGGAEKYPFQEPEIALGNSDFSQPNLTPNLMNESVFGMFRAREATAYPHCVDFSASYLPFKSTKFGADKRKSLRDPEEMRLFQVFCEEVGPWLDSMDEMKHFSQILPFYALDEPMLLDSFLACGARHLSLVDSSYGEARATYFYDRASQELAATLEDPLHDPALCGTVAVLLNAYEVLSFRSAHGMEHMAGARSLIQESHWSSRTWGVGGACFWLNITMELLGCLHLPRELGCDPDTWGVDLNFDRVQPCVAGNEESWTRRMVFICAKVSNFRSALLEPQRSRRTSSNVLANKDFREWVTYNEWCDQWLASVPRSMMPMGILHPWETTSKSAFPKIWIIKHSAILGQLLYHVTRILLAKTNPLVNEFDLKMQQSHAHSVCGILSNTEGRGLANFFIHLILIAAECLTTRDAQQEVLEILDKAMGQQNLKVRQIKDELREAWGWGSPQTSRPASAEVYSATTLGDHHFFETGHDYHLPEIFPGIINPAVAFADFSLENHFPQEYYEAPNQEP